MHITSVEAALAGVVISTVAGATTALVVQRLTKQAAHTARLWERRAEVYEFMLSQAAWWRTLRKDTVYAMRFDDLEVMAAEDLTDDSERQRLYIRVSMFGEPDVREVFDRSLDADKAFVIAFIGWRDKAKLNAQVERGERPAHEAVEGSELTRLRKAADVACNAANVRETELIDAVRFAVERVPRSRRAGISSLPRMKRAARKQVVSSQAEISAPQLNATDTSVR